MSKREDLEGQSTKPKPRERDSRLYPSLLSTEPPAHTEEILRKVNPRYSRFWMLDLRFWIIETSQWPFLRKDQKRFPASRKSLPQNLRRFQKRFPNQR
jgi:hypothetical protein